MKDLFNLNSSLRNGMSLYQKTGIVCGRTSGLYYSKFKLDPPIYVPCYGNTENIS